MKKEANLQNSGDCSSSLLLEATLAATSKTHLERQIVTGELHCG